MHLILVDTDPAFCAACSLHFGKLHGVEVVNGKFVDLTVFDCMVSPGNSFGLMEGSINNAILQFFGDSLKEKIRQRIWEEFLGEQPVGTSLLVETGNSEHPYIAHTPTMRVPMPVTQTDYAYLAMWAMLQAVRRHNITGTKPIEVIACPGLCIESDRMPTDEAVRQMALAYNHFLHPPFDFDWHIAFQRQEAIGRGGDVGISPEKDKASLPKRRIR
jgi:O-acetyl-ADP-ribose deacetylase (regulator of RNase III)